MLKDLNKIAKIINGRFFQITKKHMWTKEKLTFRLPIALLQVMILNNCCIIICAYLSNGLPLSESSFYSMAALFK